MPLDALNVYLSLLIKIQKGAFPIMPEACERVMVKTSAVLEAVDYVFYRIKSHEKMAIRHVFQRDVSMGKQDVDLDLSLQWLLDRYLEAVHATLEHRLSSLFVAHDKDGVSFCVYVLVRVRVRHVSGRASVRVCGCDCGCGCVGVGVGVCVHLKMHTWTYVFPFVVVHHFFENSEKERNTQDGNLDFEEYFGLVKKLRNDQKDTLTLRQVC